ncbi:hypothetical protein Taro_002645 [Colocasia esculenta]|uniref:Uncharacterized protein n=1 Tax=Colocasia esculenta TaxID=4460 RepID=A0A843TET0_COLES|nr:hypothetical protein [Colocasia esculenta]
MHVDANWSFSQNTENAAYYAHTMYIRIYNATLLTLWSLEDEELLDEEIKVEEAWKRSFFTFFTFCALGFTMLKEVLEKNSICCTSLPRRCIMIANHSGCLRLELHIANLEEKPWKTLWFAGSEANRLEQTIVWLHHQTQAGLLLFPDS